MPAGEFMGALSMRTIIATGRRRSPWAAVDVQPAAVRRRGKEPQTDNAALLFPGPQFA